MIQLCQNLHLKLPKDYQSILKRISIFQKAYIIKDNKSKLKKIPEIWVLNDFCFNIALITINNRHWIT